MSSTPIGTKLDNDVNENEKPKVKNVEEEKATDLEQQKIDKVEKYQASVYSKKYKNNKYGTSITPIKTSIYIVDKEGKPRKNVIKEANTSPI